MTFKPFYLDFSNRVLMKCPNQFLGLKGLRFIGTKIGLIVRGYFYPIIKGFYLVYFYFETDHIFIPNYDTCYSSSRLYYFVSQIHLVPKGRYHLLNRLQKK